MSKEALYSINLTNPPQIADELYSNVGSAAYQLGNIRRGFKGGADMLIRTASGGGGVLLTENTDYVLEGLDAYYTSLAGFNVYTAMRIINATYQTGDLYKTYRCVGTFADINLVDRANHYGTQPKSSISDLETITETPTAGAVPKANSEGKLAEGWIPPLVPVNHAIDGDTYGYGTETLAGHLRVGAGLDVSNGTVSHKDISSQASVDNSGGVVIQDVNLDVFGHVVTLGSTDLDNRYFTETELGSTTSGNSGADKIGISTITGLVGSTVRAIIAALKTFIDDHIGNSSNPHSVTKSQVGLANVTNDAQVKKITSSTDNAIMRWNGTTGDIPQDSLAGIDDNGSVNVPSGQQYNVNGAQHEHELADITDIDTVDAHSLQGIHPTGFVQTGLFDDYIAQNIFGEKSFMMGIKNKKFAKFLIENHMTSSWNEGPSGDLFRHWIDVFYTLRTGGGTGKFILGFPQLWTGTYLIFRITGFESSGGNRFNLEIHAYNNSTSNSWSYCIGIINGNPPFSIIQLAKATASEAPIEQTCLILGDDTTTWPANYKIIITDVYALAPSAGWGEDYRTDWGKGVPPVISGEVTVPMNGGTFSFEKIAATSSGADSISTPGGAQIDGDLDVGGNAGIDGNADIGGILSSAEIVLPSSAPSTPTIGSFYFNDTDDSVYCYTSAGWKKVALTT